MCVFSLKEMNTVWPASLNTDLLETLDYLCKLEMSVFA